MRKGSNFLTRRDFFAIAGATVSSLAISTSCRSVRSAIFKTGKITARPREGVQSTITGRVVLDMNSNREAILQLPNNVGPSPLPLLLMLHGATQEPEDMFEYLGSVPEQTRVAVLAPKSLDTTWDGINDQFGIDVEFLSQALQKVFDSVQIDPARVAIGGFSDGATYAVSLGLINGDLFNSVVAFSPGFVVYGAPSGSPRFFISHGTRDHILPIGRCGRRIASDLKALGYEVTFREFDGDHEIPETVVREGLTWVADARVQS